VKKPKICLVEACNNHAEVLLPQIDLLQDDYELYLIAPQSLLDLDLLSRTKSLYEGIPVDWNQKSSRFRRLLRMPGKYRDIRRIVDSIHPEVVLFNSSYRPLEMLLIAALFKGVRKGHIIHNFQYFLRPGMRWLYRQFDLSLVISEEVQRYVVQHHPQYRTLDYFLPIFFGSFESASVSVATPQTDASLQIGVFGNIENYRRNYEGLFQSLAAWRRSGRKADFLMHVVGSLPVEYRQFIARHDLGGVVRSYDDYVPFEEMFRVLRNTDVVLFLIDDSVPNSKFYNRYKISGTSSLVKGFHKVSAVSRDFPIDAVLADKCFYYDGLHLEQIFEAIENGSISKPLVREMEARYASADALSREQQKTRLLAALKRIGA
jgi:hypothetical protein